VTTGSVVEGLDVGEDLTTELPPGRPGTAVDELLLQGGEEALGDGVIEAVASGAHRAGDARLPGGLAEGQRYVLRALVGVVDQARLRAPAGDRHLQGVDDQL
jgi:hypothetical protein